MSCDARMRPFPNDTEIVCDLDDEHPGKHESTLRDYAYKGSETLITWYDNDRRSYRGEWAGNCDVVDGCILPKGHAGKHAR